MDFKYINRHNSGNLPTTRKAIFEKDVVAKLHPLLEELISNHAYIEVYHTKYEILTAVIIIPENDLEERASQLLLQVFDTENK